MGVARQNCARTLVGWVCLLAALALYAPLGAAALLAHGMACCTGDHCPIKQHHHPKKQAPQHTDMACGHDLSEAMNCSMACCDDSEKPLVTAVAFVLPGAPGVSSSSPLVEFIEIQQEVAIFRSVAPLSPPPQISTP